MLKFFTKLESYCVLTKSWPRKSQNNFVRKKLLLFSTCKDLYHNVSHNSILRQIRLNKVFVCLDLGFYLCSRQPFWMWMYWYSNPEPLIWEIRFVCTKELCLESILFDIILFNQQAKVLGKSQINLCPNQYSN